MVFALCFSIVGCGNTEEIVETPKEEIIPLTTSNVHDYLVFSKEVTGGQVSQERTSILGQSITTYTGEGTFGVKAARNDNVGFKDVVIELKLIVGYGRTREEWNFASGGQSEQEFSDDKGRFVKTVKMVVSYDGSGNVSEDMILDCSKLSIVLQAEPWDLGSSVSYEILSVRGNVIKTID